MAEPRRIAIVGASVRAAAESAVRAGYEVVAADLFADADLRSTCSSTRITEYPEGLADWLAKQSVDGWFYTGALENYADLVDRMAEISPLFGASGAVLRNARNPSELARVFRQAGLLFPEIRSITGAPIDGAWVAKTYAHSNGVGVWSLESGNDRDRAWMEGAVAQQRLKGRPHAAAFAIDDRGATLLGLTEQYVGLPITNAPEWAYCGSLGPIELQPEQVDTLRGIGQLLHTGFSLRGVVGVDLIVNDEGLWVIEINPRYTASMEVLERACRQSVVARHLACFTGEAIPDWSGEATGKHAKLILYAGQDIAVPAFFYDWAIDQQSQDLLADVPHANEPIPKSSPVVTLLGGTEHTSEDGAVMYHRAVEAYRRLGSG